MQGIKESKQALGAEVISGLEDFAPPTLLAQASRLNFSTRLFNLIVTNVPGPQFPLYLLGREMLEIVPVAFLPEDHALAIAAMSYNGKLDFGLLGDYDAMPDIDEFADHLRGFTRRVRLRGSPGPSPRRPNNAKEAGLRLSSGREIAEPGTPDHHAHVGAPGGRLAVAGGVTRAGVEAVDARPQAQQGGAAALGRPGTTRR